MAMAGLSLVSGLRFAKENNHRFMAGSGAGFLSAFGFAAGFLGWGMSEELRNESQSPAEESRRRGTLLIVDDEDGPRVSLQVVFKKDYDVLSATNGPEAIKLAEQHRVDVAVCDIKMPGMSGIEVLERLKFVDPAIEVIMMTAFETTETIRKALKLRACDYINKPFELEHMRNIVAGAMHRRALESDSLSASEKFEDLSAELNEERIQHQLAKTRGDIYGSVIHDINGPLTVVSGFAQMIEQRLQKAGQPSEKDLAFIREKMQVVKRQVGNCMEISRRYLTFLRKQTGGAMSAISVNLLLADLDHLLRVHPALLDNQFSITTLTTDVGVRLNATDVIQGILNLAVNAFQCSAQPHRVDIAADVLNAPLDIAAFRDSAESRFINVEGFTNEAPILKISVADNGPGIPPEILPKIFDTYFTTKGPKQGTGLGLNIVSRLIKEAGGAMHVQTQMGSGTAFTLFIPAIPASEVIAK
jgi:signal transduction histidine kinase